MSEEKEVKRRGPRKARNRLQEMALAGRHFVKAVEGYASVAAAKYDIEQSEDLSNLLDSMAEASESAKGVSKAFSPHYEAMRKTAELIRENAELAALAKVMVNALETTGHSDKIPAKFRVVAGQAVAKQSGARRGRPPKSVAMEQQAVA